MEATSVEEDSTSMPKQRKGNSMLIKSKNPPKFTDVYNNQILVIHIITYKTYNKNNVHTCMSGMVKRYIYKVNALIRLKYIH